MASTKERMLKARELIKQKEYDAARSILEDVEHPKAEEWLAKLDKIAPKTEKKGYSCFQIGLIALAFLLMLSFIDIFFTDYDSLPETDATSDIAESQSSAADTITLCDTASIDCLVDQVNEVLSDRGEVSEFEAQETADGRLDAYVRFRLNDGSGRDEAFSTVDRMLRLYETVIPSNSAGKFTASVNWDIGEGICGTNAAMGYAQMERIDWDNASQAEVRRILDQEQFTDTGVDYSEVAFVNGVIGIPACR